MTSHVAPSHFQPAGTDGTRVHTTRREALRFLVPVGRFLLASIFLLSGPAHFSEKMIGHAAAQGLPFAGVLVPLSGILAFAGALMIALGYRARLGALLLVAFLVPVTLVMHAFWAVKDPMMAEMQRIMFMKNLSMLGGVLLIAYYGGGPLSFDAAKRPPPQCDY